MIKNETILLEGMLIHGVYNTPSTFKQNEKYTKKAKISTYLDKIAEAHVLNLIKINYKNEENSLFVSKDFQTLPSFLIN